MSSPADTFATLTPAPVPPGSRPQADDRAAGGWRGDDFAAWLPPMVVKELRQGVQSGGFFWTFLLFQATLLFLFAVQALASESDRSTQRSWMAFFWLAAVAAVAGIVPLRGLGAIDGERRGNGLDLLQISRLSATRIVLGKWAALVAQSALVAVTILPYLVLRYFFGGVDVLADLRGLGWILAAAAALAAAAIALSTLPVWLRIAIATAAGGLSLAVIADGPGERLVERFMRGGGLPMEAQPGILAAVAVYTLACLQFAAARIAPAAENHALRRRLLALLVAAAWPVAGWLGTVPAAAATFLVTGPLLLGSAIGGILEKPSRVRTLFAPFRRAGLLGRAAAGVLTPGWASGLVFVVILGAVCLAGWIGFLDRFVAVDDRPIGIAAAALVFAAIICPLPFTTLLTRVQNPLLLYGLVQLICFLTFVIANVFKPSSLGWPTYTVGQFVTLPFPLGATAAFVISCENNWNAARELAPTFTLAALGGIAAVLAVMAWPWCRESAAVGRLVRGAAVAAPRAAAVAAARRRPAAAARAWVWQGDDLPAWLSPMLVRELRQGVQSGLFAWEFIAFQGAMFLIMAWALSRAGSIPLGGLVGLVTAFFWSVIAVKIMLIVPLHGLTMVSGERTANNLDLVRLTRLSATRIIVGKWLAVVGQGLLVATAVMPYLVVRYFFGGVNILVDLEIFGWMVVGSMAVAAAAIAASTLPVWARIAAALGVAGVGFAPIVAVFERGSRGRFMVASLGAYGRLGILAGACLFIVALLEYAAAKIAPPAENHAGRQRLIALVIAAAWAVVGVFGSQDASIFAILVAGPVLLGYAIGAMLEQPAGITAVYRPFRRWGPAGRLAAAVFTPGWATAVPFVFLLAAVFMSGWLGVLVKAGVSRKEFMAFLTLGCQILPAVLFPLPVFVWWPRLRQRLAVYGGVQMACFLVFVFLSAVLPRGMSWRSSAVWMFTLPFPMAALPAFVATNGNEEFIPAFLTAAAVTTLVVLAVVAMPWWAEMRQVRRMVRGESGGRSVPRSP